MAYFYWCKKLCTITIFKYCSSSRFRGEVRASVWRATRYSCLYTAWKWLVCRSTCIILADIDKGMQRGTLRKSALWLYWGLSLEYLHRKAYRISRTCFHRGALNTELRIDLFKSVIIHTDLSCKRSTPSNLLQLAATFVSTLVSKSFLLQLYFSEFLYKIDQLPI